MSSTGRLVRKRRTSIFLGLNITHRRQSAQLQQKGVYRSADELLEVLPVSVSVI